MSKDLQRVRGTNDLSPKEFRKFQHVIEIARSVTSLYLFEEIGLPIFEFTSVFERNLGNTSDVVTKEMYTFEDRSNESITLRPEFTASAVRYLISNGLYHNLPLRLFTYGPVFRYERPQKCRQRQFHQLNFESFGINTPENDVEILSLSSRLLDNLGLSNKVSLELNFLGDQECISIYKNKLVEYLSPYKNDLSQDSRVRLEKNPLRILDSKDENDKNILSAAPEIKDCYNKESLQHFNIVREGLELLGIEYTINNKLVRGLDYYSNIVFEYVTTHLGSQGTVLAGGCYNGLVQKMGGKDTAGIGAAAGIERIMELITLPETQNESIALIPVGDEAKTKLILVSAKLRDNGICNIILHGNNLRKRLEKTNKLGHKLALICGKEELETESFMIKNMATGKQEKVSADNIITFLTKYIKS